jgi:branched-subunit amino acid aminotransferase/4-amino-4-deoxychorismate lyase
VTALRWYNGHIVGAADAVIPLTSALVTGGEGWFETLRIESGRAMFAARHWERLAAGVGRCGADAAAAIELASAAFDHVRPSLGPVASGRLRLLLIPPTDDGHRWDWAAELVAYEPSAELLARGASVVCAPFEHPGLGWLGKSLSYHWSRVALREARSRGADEALMLRDDEVVEGATSALLWRTAGTWHLPRRAGALDSVSVSVLADHGWRFEQAPATLETLRQADAVVLSSALRLAWPVRMIGGVAREARPEVAASVRDALLEAHRADSAGG